MPAIIPAEKITGDKLPDAREVRAGPGQKPARPQPKPKITAPPTRLRSMSVRIGRENAGEHKGFSFLCGRVPTLFGNQSGHIFKARNPADNSLFSKIGVGNRSQLISASFRGQMKAFCLARPDQEAIGCEGIVKTIPNPSP